MSIKKDILWRVGLVYLVILIFALLISSKLIFLQFINKDKQTVENQKLRVKHFIIPSHRGDILTSDLKLLNSSVPYYEIRMDMKVPAVTNEIFKSNIDSLAYCLSRLFRDKSKDAYRRELVNARRAGERYYLLKSDINFLQLKELKKFPILRRGRYRGGIIYNSKMKRTRPHEDLARRTIGFITDRTTDNDVGLEGAYNSYLQGKDGYKKMQKLSGGVWMPINSDEEIEPEDGFSIVTTLNIDLQDVAHRALIEQLQKYDANRGVVVLMEVKTGDVKAIANLKKVGGTYKEVQNFAVGESTEPGSTFKLPALMTALESGAVDLGDTIDTKNGIFKYYDITIRDDNYLHGGYGKLTVQQVFEKSSNVGMAKIITGAYKNNEHVFVDHLTRMSLKDRLGIDIPGEGQPMLNYPGDPLWSGVSLAQMSYGYEVRLTPLQILTFYNAVANDGKMVKPRFVKEIRKHGKVEKTFQTQVINPSICSKPTIKKVQIALEGVVEHGTATNLKASHFQIAGKTGTTQMYNVESGSYKGDKRKHQASFVGYFPASNPRYSCIVVIYAPTGNVYYGNQVAGPVFLNIANKVYATSLDLQAPVNNKNKKPVEIPSSKNGYSKETQIAFKELGIKTVLAKDAEDWISTVRQEKCVDLVKKATPENIMPDVVTMGLKDALFLLENMGLEVEVVGRGSIRKQSIPGGTRITKGQKVTLEMKFIEG